MEFSDTSNDICVFCYKTSQTTENDFDLHRRVVKKFVNFLETFSDSSSDKNSCDKDNDNVNWQGCCKLCWVIINAFCNEYHQMKCLEMKMEWKLQRLLEIMDFAGRVPSRWFKLQEMFSQSETSLENLKGYRHNIMKNCNQRLARVEPRVLLKRLHMDDYRKKLLNASHEANSSVPDNDEPLPCTIPAGDNTISEVQKSNPDKILIITRTEMKNEIKFENDIDSIGDEHDGSEALSFGDPNSPDPDFELNVKTEPVEDNMTYGKPSKREKRKFSRKPFQVKYRKLGTKFQCDQCDSTFSTVLRLKVHLRRLHLETGVKCSVCKKVFKSRETLQAHMITHSDPSTWKYRCDMCGKRFYRSCWLVRHKIVCRVNLSSNHSRKLIRKPIPETEEDRNKYIVHPHGAKRYECRECGKMYPAKTAIRNHLFSHQTGEPLICQYCGGTYPHSRALQRHVYSYHKNEQNISETNSENYFLHYGELKEKTYECKKCGKMWRNKFQLNRHMKSHEKNFPVV